MSNTHEQQGPGWGRPVITQAFLRRFLRLKARVRRLEALRRQLLQLVDGGAAVEAGPIEVDVSRTHRQQLREGRIADAFGQEVLEQLKQQMPSTEVTRLLLRQDGAVLAGVYQSRAGGRPPAPAQRPEARPPARVHRGGTRRAARGRSSVPPPAGAGPVDF